jgi:NADPH-dependent 2,4-dienoyl-CoA reductase/sulfur reductase-like enzyme
VVIIGAGQAGGRCAEALRATGFKGDITLVGREIHPPYERPSLSKDMLIGDTDESIAWVRPAESYTEENVELRLGENAVAIDRERREVRLEDGDLLSYDVLVLATGARARTLSTPGADQIPLHVIRTIEDSRRLRSSLGPGVRVVIVGAGFIGLEVAAAARKRGAHVTVLEAGERVMARAVPPEMSAYFADLHRGHGVTLLLNTTVDALAMDGFEVVVKLSNGLDLMADIVIAGVGIEPNDELAQAAGLKTDRGIIVDEFGRTADPCIFAVGDVARHYNPLLKRAILLESWQNAQNQSIAVAKVIAGGAAPYAEIPWFWSDQFDVNLQVVGLPDPKARTIVRGKPGEGATLLLEVEDGRVVSACALNAPRELRFAKELILSRAVLDEARLADPAIRLADLVRETKQWHPSVTADPTKTEELKPC